MLSIFHLQLATILSLTALVSGQFSAPDHYWDFTKVDEVNSEKFVFDQMTKDPKCSFKFGLARSWLCTVNYGVPIIGPDGAQFYVYNQALTMEEAKFTLPTRQHSIAIWFKYIETDLTATRDDYLYSIQDWTNLYINYAIKISTPSGYTKPTVVGYFNYYNGNTGYTVNFPIPTTTLTNGWYLYSYAMTTTPITASKYNATMTVRLRGSGASTETLTSYATLNNYDFSIYYPDFKDVFVGGLCQYFGNNNYYWDDAPIATIGRIYLWKKYYIPTTQNSNYELYFYNNVNNPSCSGTGFVPCSFCSKEYVGNTVQCTTNGANNQSLYVGDWNFDVVNTQQVLDRSGNGRHWIREQVNDTEAQEPMRVEGQGYLIYNGGSFFNIKTINFQALPQFTFEFWIRYDQTYPQHASGNDYLRILQHWDTDDNAQYATIKIYAPPDQQIMVYPYQNETGYPGLSQTFSNLWVANKWHFISIGLAQYVNDISNSEGAMTAIFTVDTVTKSDTFHTVVWWVAGDNTNALTKITTNAAFYLKRLTIYNYLRVPDETKTSVKSTGCGAYGSSTCTYCPADTGTCISTCNQNQYASTCQNCYWTCGHCNGPTANDCLYCTRDYPNTMIYYEPDFGNCTCADGYYFDAVHNKCGSCDPHCATCFGSQQNQCLSCVPTGSFFSNTICVTTCADILVTSTQTNIAFYSQVQTNGPNICKPCHPYCSSCTGELNGNCQSCWAGSIYYLNVATCVDQCPSNQYRNTLNQICTNCNPACTTCYGGANNNCIICSNIAKVQQFGACQATCNNEYFADAQRICQPCDPKCALCASAGNTNCTACTTGNYLTWMGYSCNPTCADGTFPDVISNMCLMCHYSCKTCTLDTPDSCIQCAAGYLREGSFCVQYCSPGAYIVNGTCMSCDSKCTSCFGIIDTQCYSCAENTDTGLGYYLYGNTCNGTCPDGYYPDNFDRTCKKCRPECATCTTYDFCTSCVYGPYQLNNGECSFFYCLPDQYRSIRPSLSCYSCDSTCLTCQGGSQFDCLTCLPQYQLFSQQCITCDQQPGMKAPISVGVTTCVEICGDGFNYGQYQCDDGNTISGDGCDSYCMIEAGWVCSGGTPLTPDTCQDKRNPIPTLALVNSQNQLYISFDKEVSLTGTLDTKSLQITVTGPQPSYKFTWRLNDNYLTNQPIQTILIDTTFYQTLVGGSKEKVTLQFTNPTIYIDTSNNGIQGDIMIGYLSPFTYVDPVTAAKLSAAGDTSVMATFAGVAINLGISVVFGGSISAMWTMVNTIQLISLLPLCDVNWPPITVMIFQKMLSSQGETTIIPNLLYDKVLNRPGSKFYREPPLNARFKAYGWDTSNFLELSGRKVLIWLTLIIAYPLVYYMAGKYGDKNKCCAAWKSLNSSYQYTLLLRGVIMSYVSMFLAALLNIFQMQFTSMENIGSLFAAITFVIILLYLPVQIMNIMQRNYQRIATPKFMKQYSTIIAEVDTSHLLRYMYYPVFLMRRAVFAILLVLFAGSPKVQIGLMSGSCVLMIIYVCVVKPQKQTVMVVLTAFGEFLLLFLHIISIAFLDGNVLTEAQNTKYGWGIVVVIGLYIVINWVVVVIIMIKEMKEKYKAWKQKKVDITEKKRIDYEYLKWKKKNQLMRHAMKEEEKDKMIQVHDDKEREFLKQKEDEEYAQMKQEEMEDGEGEYSSPHMNMLNNNDMDYGDSQSPNPFYNPQKHHEIADAQRQQDEMNLMNHSMKNTQQQFNMSGNIPQVYPPEPEQNVNDTFQNNAPDNDNNFNQNQWDTNQGEDGPNMEKVHPMPTDSNMAPPENSVAPPQYDNGHNEDGNFVIKRRKDNQPDDFDDIQWN